jgi:hypothetical protein
MVKQGLIQSKVYLYRPQIETESMQNLHTRKDDTYRNPKDSIGRTRESVQRCRAYGFLGLGTDNVSRDDEEVEDAVKVKKSNKESDDEESENDAEEKKEREKDVPIEQPAPPAPTRQSTRIRNPSEAAKQSLEHTGAGEDGRGIRIHVSTETAARGEAGKISMLAYALSPKVTPNSEPRTVREAKRRPDWVKWEEAIQRALKMFETMSTCQELRRDSSRCPCGAALQTQEHILRTCPRYDDHREVLHEASRTLHVPTLLGTDKGLTAIVEFVERTGAFMKGGRRTREEDDAFRRYVPFQFS